MFYNKNMAQYKLLEKRRYNYIYRNLEGQILKLTKNFDEIILAAHFKNWKNKIHPMLPLIDDVRQINSEYCGIWREDLKDIDLACCDLKNLWRSLIRSNCEIRKGVILNLQCATYLQCCHFEPLLDLYLWLLNKGVIIGDLGLKNWGFRGQTLVVRDFGGIERLPAFKENILKCSVDLNHLIF
jgi:hypothetical protein